MLSFPPPKIETTRRRIGSRNIPRKNRHFVFQKQRRTSNSRRFHLTESFGKRRLRKSHFKRKEIHKGTIRYQITAQG